MLLELRLE